MLNFNKRILILIPGDRARGGISNYFSVLQDRFKSDVFFLERGARSWPIRKGHLSELFRAVNDLKRFSQEIRQKKIDVIQTSTSLGLFSCTRDGLFVLVAKFLNRKVIVFFRGWNKEYERAIDKYFLVLFRLVFFRVDNLIVLSKEFKIKLREWGYKKPIYVETTVVDDKLMREIDENFLANKYRELNHGINILYLARVEKAKGIYEAVETFKILQQRYKNLNLSLTVAGDGFELENIKNLVLDNKLKNITFPGFVQNQAKIKAFTEAHLYFFPSYTEGMPNSVLEAMAFGLPVVTRSVGGLKDVFIDGENGFITDSKDPKIFAELFSRLLDNRQTFISISLNNYRKALDKFLAPKVVERLEKIYETL